MTVLQKQVCIVQAYIHLRKEIEISVNMLQFQDPKNVYLLNKLHSIAMNWIANNNVKLEFI